MYIHRKVATFALRRRRTIRYCYFPQKYATQVKNVCCGLGWFEPSISP